MKLLFDQNLSPRLPVLLADLYPGSAHVRELGLKSATDTTIWTPAKENSFVLVSKDSDFQQRSLLFGPPPKFIWLRIGNCTVEIMHELLRKNSVVIHTFERNAFESHLMIP
jgi:predicted nuclease of predicted toxin-antitoxin system